MPSISHPSTPDLRTLRIALNATPALSRPALYRLTQDLDAWAGAWTGTSGSPPLPDRVDRLARTLGVPRAQMRRALTILAEAPAIAARELEAAERLGARLIVAGDPDYPADLGHLALPPPVLSVCGAIPSGPAVAIVGSRRTDAYGQEVAELFARALAAAGVTIVSGFARGIDAASHRGALAAEGGRTVAVLGCGLGVDYPAGHERLGREIADRGALISEFPCGLTPRAWHFPVRNRVIAALTAGTLVVQAAPRSGSLLTARWAADLGRDVWAIPGRIFDERSLGPNALIRDGAPLVQHPREILETLLPSGAFLERPAPSSPPQSGGESQEDGEWEPLPAGFPGAVLAALPPGALRFPEEVAAGLEAPVDQVLGALLELELEGRVRRHPGSAYGRV
jgi:DNA processing protein